MFAYIHVSIYTTNLVFTEAIFKLSVGQGINCVDCGDSKLLK